MRRSLGEGIELDDDRRRVDLDELHRFLSAEAYWALGRPRGVVEALVAGAARVVALYDGERMIGFARVVSDEHTIAYLADVYVHADYRGRGLGYALVREAVDGGPHAGLRWWLFTADAHPLYAKLGFGPPSERAMERPRPGSPAE